LSDAWSVPIDLGSPADSPSTNEGSPWLSKHGTTLYFFSDRPGRLWNERYLVYDQGKAARIAFTTGSTDIRANVSAFIVPEPPFAAGRDHTEGMPAKCRYVVRRREASVSLSEFSRFESG
jgi:hypothetical protein